MDSNYDEQIHPVDRIEFTTLSNIEIKKRSVFGDTVGIDMAELYDNMEPKKGSLVDTRMGPSLNTTCATCGLESMQCPGHEGHIKLSEPVFNMGFIDYVNKILRCICLKCSKLLIYKNEKEIEELLKNKKGRNRFNEIRKLTKNITYCQKQNYGCGTMVSKIKKEIHKRTAIINIVSEVSLTNLPKDESDFEGKKKVRLILTPKQIYNILEEISDHDLRIMGIDPVKSHPIDMIHLIFPVAPVPVRPSAKVDYLSASSTREDDLTLKLADIIKANIRIRRYKETNAKFKNDHFHLLQYHAATYFDNDGLSLPRAEQRGGKPLKSLSSRLKGKEGRVRGNLMGKRTDFSARTVITPDPTIDINELGVPLSIAKIITFPEEVTPHNIEKMTQLVKNGRDKYPGANYVFPVSNLVNGKKLRRMDLRYVQGKVTLRYGDIVERHIVNGDYVLLNRQPSLHKLSMMGHKVKIINDEKSNYSTFRLNLSVTGPYNADFDGDEMNIFIPQSIAAAIELKEIANIKYQIISPKTSKPVIGIVQDGLLGAYNLTHPSMSIHWQDAMNIISYTTLDNFSAIKKKKYISGKDLFSLIIPSKINLSRGKLNIDKGYIKNGILKKTELGGGKKNSLIHLIWDQYGVEQTKKFLDNAQRLVNNFNLLNGFSVGYGDTKIKDELRLQLNKMYETKKLELKHLITEMENNPDLLDEDVFEDSVNNDMNVILNQASKMVMENLDPNNNFNIMISSGSKGNPSNMGQMSACLGQQAILAKRVEKKIQDRGLSYFAQNDDSALARGFVERPFIDGASPTGFIYHNMASREGLIDTAIKSVTGDTPIIILKNNITKRVLIGDWIDKLLENGRENVKHFKERDMELLDLEHNIYIPTTDLSGNVSWGLIKSITRHDPGKELYEIQTLGGREVIVTESKSLLIWNNTVKQFTRTSTPEVSVGDYVPTTMRLSDPPIVKKIMNERKLTYLYGLSQGKLLAKNKINISTVHKYYNSPKEFIKGFFESYCQQKNINPNEKSITFASKELTIAMNMLISRLGIFGKIDKNTLSIKKLSLMEQNDVVLDQIVSIKKVDIEKYPKVYDLTVPSTLNFGLANGLHVVDTAESGYLQRKLVKAQEDAMVKYDCTVRNANNRIIQYIYGDSGIDSTKQTEHTSKLILMGNSEISRRYKFTKEELRNYPQFTAKQNDDYYKYIMELRNKLRNIKTKLATNFITLDTTVVLPMNLYRIIQNAKSYKSDNSEKLVPNYILEKLENILDYSNTQILTMSKKEQEDKKSIKQIDEMLSKSLMRYALHEFLAPKICIFELKFTKKIFDKVCKKIIDRINRSIIQPGEMVGIIAAQSLGETLTQLTLNSIDWKEKIIIKEDNITKITKIGKYIDDYINNNSKLVTKLEDNIKEEMSDTYYIDVSKKNIKAISVDKDGKISWNKVTALTKHLPMNRDGTNELVKIKTRLGKSVIATKAKSFLTRKDNEILPIRGDELKIGTKVPVMIKYPDKNDIEYKNLENINREFCLNDVYLDEIVNIELVKPSHKYVYDLTVENDKTFIKNDGLALYDTFHHAGIGAMGTATLGVPRIKEILSFSPNQKTPMMFIYLQEKYKNNKIIANKIASHIKYTTIKDIRDKIQIYYDPLPYSKGGFMEQDNVFNVYYTHKQTKNTCQSDISNLPWLLRLEINREQMLTKGITLLEIKSKFCDLWEKRYINIKKNRKEKRLILEQITQCAILSNDDNNIQPMVHIRFDMKNLNHETILKFLDIFIENFKLKGILGIKDVIGINEERVVSFDNEDQISENKKQYIIYTSGVNMIDLRYFNGIDLNRTTSNNIIHIYNKFGIEAVRSIILKELKTVYSSNFVNYQHLSLLIDFMTNTGRLTPINRHGLGKLDTDPLARASFEKTVDQLLTAAVFGEVDHMNSVSSRIMTGLVVKGGTGYCGVKVDNNFLENSEYIELEHKFKKTFRNLRANTIISDILKREIDDIFVPK